MRQSILASISAARLQTGLGCLTTSIFFRSFGLRFDRVMNYINKCRKKFISFKIFVFKCFIYSLIILVSIPYRCLVSLRMPEEEAAEAAFPEHD